MSTPPRTAIITGAAQGVGKAIALRLSTDGCQVVVSDSTSQKLLLDELVSKITRTGRAAISVTADVSVESDVEDLVAKTVAHFGSIDIMVANDGAIAQSAHTILDTSVEEWGRVFDPNVTNTLLCYKTAARAMIKQNRGGRIIGVCSSGEKSRCNARSTNNAIRGLTQIAACEWEKYGITVNGYAPGASDAPLVQQMDARVADLLHAGPEAYVEIMKTQTAFGRVNRPEEVVCVVSFLASEEAAFMTGQTLTFNSGLCLILFEGLVVTPAPSSSVPNASDNDSLTARLCARYLKLFSPTNTGGACFLRRFAKRPGQTLGGSSRQSYTIILY